MPYYFNFRHYLELEFKALIIGLTKRAPEVSHCLKKLYKEAKKAICSNNMIVCDVDEEKSGLSKHGDGCEELCKVIIEIGALLDEYLRLESSADYYRYIFTSKMTLEKPVIELDYKKTDKLFRELAKAINKLNCCLIDLKLRSISGRNLPYTF